MALLAIWVVYPGVIAILSRVRRRRLGPGVIATPRVSVVIATRETAGLVLERIRDCLRTTYAHDRLEIIVAHDRNSPAIDTADLNPSPAEIRIVAADAPGGKAGALNAGVRAATGEVVVFADTHQRFDEHAIPRLVEAVSTEGVGAATGNYELAPGAGALVSFYWRFERWLRSAEARVHSSVGATGAVYAIRRALWSPLPSGLILDDVYTPMRIVLAGQRVEFVEQAHALELRAPTPTQEYGRKVRTLTGVLQLCAWLPGVLLPWRNPIWPQFVFHKVLRLLTPWLLVLLVAALLATLVTTLSGASLLAGAIAVLAALSWVALSRGHRGSRLRHFLLEAVLLQIAVLMAGINGLRGRWQVWDA
jgi:cellulose synthase/poly-beta-1,6-N-acetylglucosamine synthase-like glycosyltransferase